MYPPELRLRPSIVDRGPVVIWGVTPAADSFVFVNDTYERLFGHSPAPLVEDVANYLDHVHPADRQSVVDQFERMQAQSKRPVEQTVEYRRLDSDGMVHWVRETITPLVEDETLLQWTGYCIDITTEKQFRQRHERRASELEGTTTRLELALDGSETGVWVWEIPTDEVTWDDRTHELFGYDSGRFPGSYEAFLETIYPDDVSAVESAIEQALANGVYDIEFRVLLEDESTRWVHAKAAVLDDDGEPEQLVGVVMDATEQKLTQSRVEQQRDYLDLLNGILSHDIRNDLQSVLAVIELFESLEADEDSSRHIERALSNIESAISTTQTVRHLSELLLEGDQPADPTPLASILETELTALQRSEPQVSVVVSEPIPSVNVPGGELLSSVFQNLLTNAVKHNDSEQPAIVVGVTERDADVSVTIADNGPGIRDEYKTKVFEPGWKGYTSGGTGMGLSLVSIAVKMYGGSVEVTDNQPRGTVVNISLPVESATSV